MSLNAYSQMDNKEKKKYFKNINKNYLKQLEVQGIHFKQAQEIERKIGKTENVQKKKVSFSD